jgi:dTMP kinase
MLQARFIAIDGTDGSGKTVQAARLVQRIRETGRAADTVSFPRYGAPAAYFVEQYLRGVYGSAEEVGAKRASVFYALDRFDDAAHIRKLLHEGTTLVTNRYVSANKGHQMGKIKDPAEQRAFLDWLNELEYGTFNIPKPDLTILLHVPAEIGKRLAESRDGEASAKDIHQADLRHLKDAEAAYLRLPEIDTAENWKLIECTEGGELMPIEAIHEKIWTLVEPLLI